MPRAKPEPKPDTQDSAALREQVARLNAEVSRLKQDPGAAAAGPPQYVDAWAKQLAPLAAGGKLDFVSAFEKALDITASEDRAVLKRFAGQLARRQYNAAFALGVDPAGYLVWGGGYNFRTPADAAETAQSYCMTGGVDACKPVVVNGNFNRDALIDALKPLGRRPVDAVRAAFVKSLAQPLNEAPAGMSDVIGRAGTALPPMGYTFERARK